MKNILITIIVLICGVNVYSQNRINYSQYMHNHQIFNPAYKFESADVGGNLFYRNQWFGVEGAPETYIGNAFYNLNNHGFNLQFLSDKITIFKHTEIGLSYSYRLKLNRHTTLSFGVKATYNQQVADYNQLSFFDGIDNTLQQGTLRSINYNFGFGTFLRNKNYHVGFGAPYIFNNKSLGANVNMYDLNYNHFYITGGYKIIDEKYFMFYPTSLIKWTKGAPIAASLDLNVLYLKRYWGSIGYRLDNTAVLSVGIIFLKDFKFVYSYDLGLGRVNKFGGMTHEVSLGYGMDLFTDSFTKRKYISKKMRWKKKVKRPR